MTFLLALVLAQANAPEPHAAPRTESAPQAPGAFFRDCAVDFWGDRKRAAAARAAAEQADANESIWAEPIKTSDGRTTVHVPPKAVLGFLENPTRENAKAYLAWQGERMKKLKAAMELLRELKEEKDAGAAVPEKLPSPAAVPRTPYAGEILYFKKKGCPWCLEEDKALAELVRARPDLKVRAVSLEESPELAKEHAVTVVPTLIVPARGGRKLVLRGFVPAAQLARVIEEANREEK